MKVLITGGAGSIGVHMVYHFLKNTDWDIIVVDSFRHAGAYDRLPKSGRLTTIAHDLIAPFSEREIKELLVCDYIINLASLSDVQASIDDPVPFLRNNHEIMINMLELAREIQPLTFLHFSTDEVYGPAAINQGHKEWSTILPSNPYAASKAAQEAYAIAYWRSYGVPVIITNTMNNFGEMQQPSKYPVIVQNKVEANETVEVHSASDGTIGTRYYIHSRNVADAVLFLLRETNPYLHKPGEVDRPDRYNIVGDKQVSNLELAEIIAELMGSSLKYKLVNFHDSNPGHDVHYGLDGKKMQHLGWQQPVDFETSLKNTINWQQEHKRWI